MKISVGNVNIGEALPEDCGLTANEAIWSASYRRCATRASGFNCQQCGSQALTGVQLVTNEYWEEAGLVDTISLGKAELASMIGHCPRTDGESPDQ